MVEFRYRGRKISQEDILYIRALIEQHPQEAAAHCRPSSAKPGSGARPMERWRDMVCRGLLLMLDRCRPDRVAAVDVTFGHNPLARRARPTPLWSIAPPIEGARRAGPLEFQLVRRTGMSRC